MSPIPGSRELPSPGPECQPQRKPGPLQKGGEMKTGGDAAPPPAGRSLPLWERER